MTVSEQAQQVSRLRDETTAANPDSANYAPRSPACANRSKRSTR